MSCTASEASLEFAVVKECFFFFVTPVFADFLGSKARNGRGLNILIGAGLTLMY